MKKNSLFKKIAGILALVVVIIAVLFLVRGEYQAYATKNVTIGTTSYTSYVADTPELQTLGLSGKQSLPNQHAMLFIFNQSDEYVFWMKDMLFSIDIIWLSADKKIVHIEQNLSPASYPERFSPEKEALYVIEIPAGDAEKYNFSVGEEVHF